MEGNPSIQVCAEVTDGTIEAGDTFTALIGTSPGTASPGMSMHIKVHSYMQK